MNVQRPALLSADTNNTRAVPLILGLAFSSSAIYLGIGIAGDLRQRPLGLFAAVGLLVGMAVAVRAVVRRRKIGLRIVLGAALVFRLLAALGPPALSDDIYRYVWDGRVQVDGFHPYAHAPAAPELGHLRDEVWSKINHPELPTIYPPLAQALFTLLAWIGAGPLGFKLAMGICDFGVVLALRRWLRIAGLPADRVVLYAWNPLAVIETAGSGHLEPVGVLLVLLAVSLVIAGRPFASALALGASLHAKVVSSLLLPGFARRLEWRPLLLLVVVAVGLLLPYALTGPAIGGGLFVYAERWQHNASLFAGVERLLQALDTGESLKPWIGAVRQRLGEGALPWDLVYRGVWPGPLARAIVVVLLVAWILRLTFRRGLDAARETFLVFAGALVLAPTVHPWYVLWILPFAAGYRSIPWLAFSVLVFLSYTGGEGEVAGWVRVVEYGPLFALLAREAWRGELYLPEERGRRHPRPG